jgi:hypothetical protein
MVGNSDGRGFEKLAARYLNDPAVQNKLAGSDAQDLSKEEEDRIYAALDASPDVPVVRQSTGILVWTHGQWRSLQEARKLGHIRISTTR